MQCKVCSSLVVKRTDPNLNMTVPNDFPLKGDLDLAICTSCGFVFNDNSSSDSDYTTYYKNLNKHHQRDGILKDIDISYFTELLQFLADQTEFRINGSTVLDYGSGALLFSELAIERGAKHAINFDIGKQRIDGKYDFVISTHCFEHILDPVTAFRGLAAHVVDDGFICIAVPDLSRYHEAYYGPYAHFDLEHINHFSFSSLSKLFEINGFNVVAVRHADRMVTKTLAYSEVLIVGGKLSSHRLSGMANHRECSTSAIVESLLERSSGEMCIMLREFKAIVEEVLIDGNSVIGMYGLSSYAFRFISVLGRNDLFQHISFFADSDPRISKYKIGNCEIFNKQQFRKYLDTKLSVGKKVCVVVAAINGFRIMQMFEEEFKGKVAVRLLPPDCQNRKDS